MNLGRRFGSIFSHTLILVVGVVLAVAMVNVAIILFHPPPTGDPVSALEVAQLLKGAKSGAEGGSLRAGTMSSMPPATEPGQDALRAALGQAVQTEAAAEGSAAPSAALQQGQLPDLQQLEGPGPVIFGPFTVALRQPDGSWRVVSGGGERLVQRWRSRMVLWILCSVLLVLPIAWWFSRRIARPIRAFGAAAEQLGRHHDLKRVEVSGPAEIRQAASALNEMQARLEKYVRERTSVVGAIAHDLRTPLSRLHFHLLPAPDNVRRRAEAEIAEMEQMISVTLDFVQNETRRRDLEALDLGLLVEGVVDDLADMGADVRMTGVVPVTMMGDSVLLRRLFANLIQNALAYGGSARVSVGSAPGRAIVDVVDEGPGMAEADLERAFEPFYRAESSRNRTTGGMGLGLAIVQSAARAHGGEVQLMNRPEGGLCARVTLPAWQMSPECVRSRAAVTIA